MPNSSHLSQSLSTPAEQDAKGDFVESLRRISQSIASGLDLRSVLQAIVDALCDHTQWQLCWIYAMDMHGGFGEIAARRDRMEYTTASPKHRWPLQGYPAIDALSRNEILTFPDVSKALDYPIFLDDALRRGTTAAAIIPLSSKDPLGRPMVLCVQSTLPLLADASQLPFLRAVASLASLAATNAGLLTEARDTARRAAKSASLLESVIDGISAGKTTADLLSEIEHSTNQPLLVFDRHGALAYVGRAIPALNPAQEEWERAVTEQSSRILGAIDKALNDVGTSGTVQLAALDELPALNGTATRYSTAGVTTATVLTLHTDPTPNGSHVSASLASAMVLLRDRLSFEAQALLRLDVVSQLLEGVTGDEYDFTSKARFAGVPLDRGNLLVVVRPAPAATREQGLAIHKMIEEQLRIHSAAYAQIYKGNHIIFIPAAPETEQAPPVLSRLKSLINSLEGGTGAVATWSGPCRDLSSYQTAWRSCTQVIDLAEKIGRTGVLHIEDFGAYRVLLPALATQDISSYIASTIGPLLKADKAGGGSLFETVEAFSNLGGRFQETARLLHVHVSTLRYRLSRAEVLLSRDLSDDETRFELALASRLERLRQGGQSYEH
jgi:sugar diacid utilization regulator